MKNSEILDKIEGIHSIESVCELLNIDKIKAVKLISRLRKKGYVETKQTSTKKRRYYISTQRKIGGKSYYEIINKYSPLKLYDSEPYRIYGREPSLEEVLIYAIKTRKVRPILASLALFRRIKNWTLLGELARKNHVQRSVGALYDLSRGIMKTPKMDERIRKGLLSSEEKYLYMIDGFESDNFKDIEKRWKVHIPLNMADLEEYLIW